MAPNGIRQKADAVKPQISKPRSKLSVQRPGGHCQGFCFHNMLWSKARKGYFAKL